MSHPHRPWRAWASALLLCSLLVGCTSLTARIAGWYITREIDSYLDLSSAQRKQARAEVDQILVVIRRDALPQWIALFRKARDTVAKGATDAQLKELQSRYDALMDAAVDTLTPPLGRILAGLSEDQIAHFEARMLEKLDEVYEEQELSPDERREHLDEELIEGLEEYTGDLSDAQVRLILDKVHSLPNDRDAQYQVGLKRIHAGAQFLRTHHDAAAIEAELKRLWDTRYQVLGPNREKPIRRAQQREILLTIDGSLTEEQREETVDTLNSLIRKVQRFQLSDG